SVSAPTSRCASARAQASSAAAAAGSHSSSHTARAVERRKAQGCRNAAIAGTRRSRAGAATSLFTDTRRRIVLHPALGVRAAFLLPERRARLELLDQIAARVECGRA